MSLSVLGLDGAPTLLRHVDRMQRLAVRLRALGKAGAARLGIGPLEYEAILGTRFTAVGAGRLDELWNRLMGPDAAEG